MKISSGQEAQPTNPGEAASHAGVSQELARLIGEHNRALHAFLMIRLRDEQEAREVVQEAYVQVLQLHQPGAVNFLRAYQRSDLSL